MLPGTGRDSNAACPKEEFTQNRIESIERRKGPGQDKKKGQMTYTYLTLL